MVREVKQGRKKIAEEISLDKFNIGEIRIRLYVFDRDSAIVNQFILDKKSFKDYLDENGNVNKDAKGVQLSYKVKVTYGGESKEYTYTFTPEEYVYDKVISHF